MWNRLWLGWWHGGVCWLGLDVGCGTWFLLKGIKTFSNTCGPKNSTLPLHVYSCRKYTGIQLIIVANFHLYSCKHIVFERRCTRPNLPSHTQCYYPSTFRPFPTLLCNPSRVQRNSTRPCGLTMAHWQDSSRYQPLTETISSANHLLPNNSNPQNMGRPLGIERVDDSSLTAPLTGSSTRRHFKGDQLCVPLLSPESRRRNVLLKDGVQELH